MIAETTPHLRPLRLVEILDQAVRLYRQNFWKFVGIIAVVQIPVTVLTLLLTLLQLPTTTEMQELNSLGSPTDTFGPEYYVSLGGGCLIALIAFILVQGVATAALTRAIANHYLERPISFVEAYRKVGESWSQLVGVMLLSGLINLLLVIWFLVPCIGWLTGLGILLFYSQAIMPLAIPIVVLEGHKGYSAIRRGWDLARRRFWWVAGFVAILYLFNQLIISGPAFLIQVLFSALGDSLIETTGALTLHTLQTLSETLLTLITSLLYLPLQLACMTLLYFDLRVRTEGFDLALLADSTMNEEIDVDVIMAQAPAAESAGLVTWPELGYFAAISLGLAAIGAILYLLLGGAALAAMGAAGGF